MGVLDHFNDASAVPPISIFTDFTRQDDPADGGALDFTTVSSGTNNGTIAIQATGGGFARISGVATTDATGGQIQGPGAFTNVVGKNIVFKCKAVLNDSTSTNVATESQQYIGLFPVDTSIDASLPTDGIYFVKADGGTTVQCITRVGSSNTTTSVAAATFTQDKSSHRFGITVFPAGDLLSTVEFSIDGVTVARHVNVSLPAVTVILAPAYAFRSGDATGTKWADVDYIGAYQDR